MYKRVLYSIKKMKKCVGGGAIFEPKNSLCIKQKNKKVEKMTEPG